MFHSRRSYVYVCSNKKEVKKLKDTFESKNYIHFDNKIEFSPKVENYVRNFSKNCRHNFLPLIYDELHFEKYLNINKLDDKDELYIRSNPNGTTTRVPIKTKVRPIMYASHLDNFLYKYYGLELNSLYNNFLIENKFDEVSVAYRTNKNGKSNIDFSAEVIDFIKKHDECYIYVGDFKGFFENLDHKFLKSMLLLLYKGSPIPKHQYMIWKNLTNYSYIYKEDISFYTDYKKGKYEKGYQRAFKTAKDFRSFKTEKSKVDNFKFSVLKTNPDPFGIPQGTAISSIYSNIYMLQADNFINTLVSNKNGIYRRYSDDYIVILPDINYSDFKKTKIEIDTLFKQEAKLSIHPKKTQSLKFSNGTLHDVKTDLPCRLDYLGFSFDGEFVKMREKSIYNYYRTAYELIKKGFIISKKKAHTGSKYRLTYKRKLYQKYHKYGEITDKKYNYKPRVHGTFISYAYKCQRIFDQLSPNTTNLMKKQISNHEFKLKKKIVKVNKDLKNLSQY